MTLSSDDYGDLRRFLSFARFMSAVSGVRRVLPPRRGVILHWCQAPEFVQWLPPFVATRPFLWRVASVRAGSIGRSGLCDICLSCPFRRRSIACFRLAPGRVKRRGAQRQGGPLIV